MKLFATDFQHVVMQPTTTCNLNCSYCYLPDRRLVRRMSPTVARAVASAIDGMPQPIRILWHGGEPLACGVEWMRSLLEPFQANFASGRLTFGAQTNATLIDDAWCELFRTFRFDVGVSIDGSAAHNAARRNSMTLLVATELPLAPEGSLARRLRTCFD